jgi:hypothetical protein
MDPITEDLLSSAIEPGIDQEMSEYIIETSKWTKFIAIAFFISAALGALLFVFYWDQMRMVFMQFNVFAELFRQNTTSIIAVAVFSAVVLVITYIFLLDFANKIRTGIETESIDLVNKGLNSLKIHLMIIGAFLILELLFTFYNMI